MLKDILHVMLEWTARYDLKLNIQFLLSIGFEKNSSKSLCENYILARLSEMTKNFIDCFFVLLWWNYDELSWTQANHTSFEKLHEQFGMFTGFGYVHHVNLFLFFFIFY